LLSVFDSVYLIALAVWVGGTVLLASIVTTAGFAEVGRESPGRLARALYRAYYTTGAMAGAVALSAFVAGPLCFPEYRGPGVAIGAAAILAGTLAMLYGGNTLTPAISAARAADDAGGRRVAQLQRKSMLLNLVVLLIGSLLTIGFAIRPAPRTSGIQEPGPLEQVRLEGQIGHGERAQNSAEQETLAVPPESGNESDKSRRLSK
jgi:hypothetical protein